VGPLDAYRVSLSPFCVIGMTCAPSSGVASASWRQRARARRTHGGRLQRMRPRGSERLGRERL
jgi:hypothetical protein